MKNLYVVSIVNAKHAMVSYNVVAASMADAVAGAQKQAGVGADVEPSTFQKLASIDFEV